MKPAQELSDQRSSQNFVLRPGDLVVVDEKFATSFSRVVGVDYCLRELHNAIKSGMMMSEFTFNQIPNGTFCTVLELKDIEIKYVSKVTQSNRQDNFDWFDDGYSGKVRPRFYYEDYSVTEYGFEIRSFAKVLTPKSIGWIRAEVLA